MKKTAVVWKAQQSSFGIYWDLFLLQLNNLFVTDSKFLYTLLCYCPRVFDTYGPTPELQS